ncbi:MAG: hypothetical protein P1P65_06405 [Treponema sp.]
MGAASTSIKESSMNQAVITLLLLGALFMFLVAVKTQNTALNLLQQQKEQSLLLADEVKQSSQELTRLCQLFVITNGKETYRQEYNALVKWRSGKQARPESVHYKLYPGRIISQTDLLHEFGCTEEEMQLLHTATQLSNELIAIEDQAMDSIHLNQYAPGLRIPDEGETVKEFASRILFDDEYYGTIMKIMEPIDAFYYSVTERTDTAVREAQHLLSRYETVALVFIVLVMCSVGYFFLFVNMAIINPITRTANL